MAVQQFKHTRIIGKKLTYDVETSGTQYVIRLNGKVLRFASCPPLMNGFDAPSIDAACRGYAIADIETLTGMVEE
jgi:hypothetical protein